MFMEKLAKNINDENFAEMIDLKNFEQFKEDFKKIESNSALRKIYDSYLDIYDKPTYDVEKQIWIARIAYQEKRGLLPTNGYNKRLKKYVEDSFTEFIKELDKNLSKENFRKFLEVFVAYHKFFTGAK